MFKSFSVWSGQLGARKIGGSHGFGGLESFHLVTLRQRVYVQHPKNAITCRRRVG
jgi:hypothetical protein